MLTQILSFTFVGLVTGAAYAIASSGLVITYATSNVFNMAHGAVGMVMAFLYWELQANRGLPPWLALVVVVVVAAPLFGALLERTMMRRLTNASVTVMLTVTVALFVLLLGAAQFIWPPGARSVQPFFAGSGVRFFGVVVSGHQLLTFALALVVAGGLYLLLNRTRTGIAMRALVDNRELLALHGARPGLLGSLSWAIGSALAALAGILLASELGLDYIPLTLLVINAYAAAMVGRLVSLPRTFVGAMVLGLLQAYFLLALRYIPSNIDGWLSGILGGLRAAIPTLFLFVTMLLLPQEKLRVGAVAGAAKVAVPTRARSIGWGLALVATVAVVTGYMGTSLISALSVGLATALIMLSLVLLTGYGGDVSLSQMTFVGVGALVVARVFGTVGPVAMLAAAIVAGLVGALVALPALRLRGLYLGLGTLAFAVAMDLLVFENAVLGFQLGGSILVERPTILGVSMQSERAFAIVAAAAFVGVGWLVLGLRRGRFGRRLLASRDSAAACGTLGISITRTRIAVFSMSAAIAGFAGAIYAGVNVSVGAADFAMFQSLPLLLLAVVGGITSVTGALLGGLLLGMGPALGDMTGGTVAGMENMVIGALAILVVTRVRNGIAGMLFDLAGSKTREAGSEKPDAEPASPVPPAEESEEVTPVGAS
jgi:branched-chain amino acid transport system permease protein